MKRGFLSVDYTEGDQSTYKRLVLEDLSTKAVTYFDTGDPVVDFYDYYKFLYSGDAKQEGYYIINHLSSVDHFFMDGGDVVERYFWVDDRDVAIVVPYEEIVKMQIDELYTCVMYDWMSTDFKDLNEYVKQKKT